MTHSTPIFRRRVSRDRKARAGWGSLVMHPLLTKGKTPRGVVSIEAV